MAESIHELSAKEGYRALIRWHPSDVQTLFKEKWGRRISLEKAQEVLDSIEGHLADRLTELGWEVMEDLISFDSEPKLQGTKIAKGD